MCMRMLQTVYKKLTGAKRNCARISLSWEVIGFQGSDPATDFRDMGMLPVLCMLYLVEHHTPVSWVTTLRCVAAVASAGFCCRCVCCCVVAAMFVAAVIVVAVSAAAAILWPVVLLCGLLTMLELAPPRALFSRVCFSWRCKSKRCLVPTTRTSPSSSLPSTSLSARSMYVMCSHDVMGWVLGKGVDCCMFAIATGVVNVCAACTSDAAVVSYEPRHY